MPILSDRDRLKISLTLATRFSVNISPRDNERNEPRVADKGLRPIGRGLGTEIGDPEFR